MLLFTCTLHKEDFCYLDLHNCYFVRSSIHPLVFNARHLAGWDKQNIRCKIFELNRIISLLFFFSSSLPNIRQFLISFVRRIDFPDMHERRKCRDENWEKKESLFRKNVNWSSSSLFLYILHTSYQVTIQYSIIKDFEYENADVTNLKTITRGMQLIPLKLY